MANFLLEIYSEEIPASMQNRAVLDLAMRIKSSLNENGVDTRKIETQTFSTPQRLVFLIKNLPTTTSSIIEEKRGPRDGAPKNAIDGFAKSVDMKFEELELRETKKGKFYFANKEIKGKDLKIILKKTCDEVLAKFTWPKSMRWGSYDIRWVRPIHSILAIFDGKIVDIEFGHIKASNTTKGHRFLDNKTYKIESADDYFTKLKNAFVILCPKEREKIIIEQIEKLLKPLNLKIFEDNALLSENANLCEYPNAILGKFDEKYQQLPEIVSRTSMRSHQKFFSCLDSKGKMAPYFIAISNVKPNASIKSGFERVLTARLEDAEFFIDEDNKTDAAIFEENLKKIVFHAKLGTVYDKVKRMQSLAKLVAVWIPHTDFTLIDDAVKYSKLDLSSELVGEFPELQGIAGSFYAKNQQKDKQIITAVKEHYLPAGPNDKIPTEPLAALISIVDKIDSLVGLFLIDQAPTGSKDPFALRRAALGIIRIIIKNNLKIPLSLLIDKAILNYPASIIKKDIKTEKKIKKELAAESKNLEILSEPKKIKKKIKIPVPKGSLVKGKQRTISKNLLEFFIERLKYLLKDQDIRHDYIQAVFDDGKENDVLKIVVKAKALNKKLQKKSGDNLIENYKRASGIIENAIKEDISFKQDIKKDLLTEIQEIKLYESFENSWPKLDKYIKNNNYEEALDVLLEANSYLKDFFDNVTVNSEDRDLKQNRLAILDNYLFNLRKIAEFNVIG